MMQDQMTKICSKCGECKPSTNEFFYLRKSGSLEGQCKSCRALAKKKRRASGVYKEYDQEYKQKNKERVSLYYRDYYQKNKDKRVEQSAWRIAERRRTDPLFALANRVRALIRGKIRAGGFAKTSKTRDILGCEWEVLQAHIERQFLKGMSWEKNNQWHIDHIIPLATAKTEEDVIRLNHYTNLRPLWAEDNLRKGARIDYII